MKNIVMNHPEYMYADGSLLESEGYQQHTSTRFRNYWEGIQRFPEKPLPHLYDHIYECCGCSACEAVCPKQAIRMENDEEGFLYPVVDLAKCVRCMQCEQVCAFKVNDEM